MKFRNSQRGVALVLTLIMLAIITIVVVVFLATARRNRSATTVRKDQTAAEFANEAGNQHANARIVAQILRDTNLLSFDFLVSSPLFYIVTNRPQDIPSFRPWPFPSTNHRPFNLDEIPIVANSTGSVDVYLDLNRNGQFDDPRPLGDPIWRGVREKPELRHGPNNHFIARFAYAVIPTGKALDLNTIHNAASPNNGLKFSRNQGFGPWEMNLAAFFAELSPTNWWVNGAYNYGPFPKPIASGMAFEDARSIVDYRNAWGRDLSPRRLMDTYPAAFGAPFPPTSIDAYADGNAGAVLGFDPFFADDDTPSKINWAGADTTNHFFDIQELFHVTNNYAPNKVTPQFYNNLSNAIANDPSVYYRLIAQLNTDSGSDYHDRLNLNYAAIGTNSAADFVPWDASPALAVTFFTNVAERIFRAQSNEFNNLSTNQIPLRSITQVPIYPTNLYSTAIHRILQEAANIFDATRTNELPSVFRPIFGTLPGDPKTLYITSFVNDERVSTLRAWIDSNTNGIPLVIGAKKGLPNFNEFTLRSDILVSRKLQVTRPDNTPGTQPNGTNQMYVLGISNYFGVEAWNSYDVGRAGPYPRTVSITVSNYALMSLTNNLGPQTPPPPFPFVFQGASGTNITGWRGGETLGFVLPFNTNTVFLSNAVYRFGQNRFVNVSTNDFESYPGFPLPYWVFSISNRLTFLISEGNRILDFVLLTDGQSVDLYRDLVAGTNPYDNLAGMTRTLSALWDTNRYRGPNGPTEGLLQQLQIALGIAPTASADWRAYALTRTGTENDKDAAVAAFRDFCGLSQFSSIPFTSNTTLAMQAPFNPSAKLAVLSTWQANDPLVHYHATDLRMGGAATNHQYLRPSQPATNVFPSSLGHLNDRYSPWGGRPTSSADQSTAYDRSVKDAGVASPDDWQFPNNKLASIGLLGRIHRGTPWQTIYLKSEAAPFNTWTNQSADIAQRPNGVLFSRTHPTNDWKLADMFTTAIDERTSRGLLSVNQTNIESWSALLSGVVVLSNDLATPLLGQLHYFETNIEPNGANLVTDTPLGRIWNAIHAYQTNVARPLQSVGDLLQVPELTVASPFLNQSGDQTKWGLDDFAYERIPQQILSLLRIGQSRFVIYAYGQALKPAQVDPGSGSVVNYQVTAEYATRTVVRAEGDPLGRVRLVVESFNILPPD